MEIFGRHFSCCADETVRKYYRAVNSVLHVDGRSDDIVMFRLIVAHCVPILSYAIEVVNITDRRQMSRMRAAYNSVFRKLFNYLYRESVTDLQHMLGRPTWEELIAKRKNNFLKNASRLPVNSLVRVTCN